MSISTVASLILLAALATFAPQAAAQVFKCKQSSGLVVYSDKPCEFAPQTTDVRLVTRQDDASHFDKAPAPDQKSLPAISPPTADATAATAKPASARTLLRALGPDQALDSQGKVYKRTAGGYIDGQGTFIPGVARGHR
jgi:Domain of unknown function (DUF4124)